jgi:hypothetical protein
VTTTRDARYRREAQAQHDRAEQYRVLAINALAALVISSNDGTWLDLLDDGEDVRRCRGRIADLRQRMVGRPR